VSIEGSPVTALVHSVMEIKSSNPARWIVTLVEVLELRPNRSSISTVCAFYFVASHRFIRRQYADARFSERSLSPFSGRHLARFRNDFDSPIVPDAAIGWLPRIFSTVVTPSASVTSTGPYFGATNWPWSQSIVALDCMGSPSLTAVLSWCEQRRHSKVRRS
jgi:hypothetical protein